MRIKTITCHDVYNLGASLQAYALTFYLKEQGHDAQIINYKPPYLQHYRLLGGVNPTYDKPFLKEAYQIAKFPSRLYQRFFSRRKKVFDYFTKNYLPITFKKYTCLDELYSDPPPADLYIAGSDQIWNPLFQNGKDPAFFLDFVDDNKRKISYAASFAVEKLMTDDAHRMYNWLKKLDAIAVRESSALRILSELKLKGNHVMDPVFLLDRKEWEKLTVKPKMEDYILVYDFDNSDIFPKIAKDLSLRTGKKVVSLFKNNWADLTLENAGPLEFLGAILNSAIVLSNSFHATAFSLIFQKDFYIINRIEKINTRMVDLAADFHLEERIISESPTLIEKIDFADVQPILERKIAVSKEYLWEQIQLSGGQSS